MHRIKYQHGPSHGYRQVELVVLGMHSRAKVMAAYLLVGAPVKFHRYQTVGPSEVQPEPTFVMKAVFSLISKQVLVEN